MTGKKIKLTGGCMCGGVRFQITGTPMAVSHCHCADCRRSTGAPFMTWITAKSEDFAYSLGMPKEYASSATVRRAFCERCGTALAYRSEDHPEEVDVSAAALDDPQAVTPDDHLWIGSKLSWIELGDDLPRLEAAHWGHGYPKRD
ncbi:MAG: GFA family protein [Alphaproteobacteria bacterium]|nr:GFA family protein [Alphaproteobacteria bacterium]